MDIYNLKDYKEILKIRLKDLKKKDRPITLRKVADLIPIQYTYLSKVLNHDEHDLSEDHLFTICRILDFHPEELDYVLTTRAWKTSRDNERKNHLYNQIEKLQRQKKLNIENLDEHSVRVADEMNYLLNPMCLVVHVALTSQILRTNPQSLCSKLGIEYKQLKEILKILSHADLIDLGPDGITVKSIKKLKFHISRAHPLTRVHQNLLKNALLTRLNQTEEECKQSFMALFTLNKKGFEQIQDEFQIFLKKVETIAAQSKKPLDHQNVYSLNFDLFKWL